jgi:hypothetical protein
VGKDCFSETIDHGCGKLTLFGRVLAEMPEDPARQNVRSALIPVPPGLKLETYVINASFVTADPDDPHRNSRSFRSAAPMIPPVTASPSRPTGAATTPIPVNMCASTSLWRRRGAEAWVGPRPHFPLSRASASATCCFTVTKLSGVTEIESMPQSTRNSANAG